MDSSATLVEDFQRYFELQLATTPSLLEKAYRVRYRVYCEEFQYESADAFPNQLETDEFDQHSSHCLVMHKASGMPAGCARLVMVNEQSVMPMEKFCSSAIEENIIRAYDGKRDTICEFSRLGVDGAFRRRAGERASRFGEITALDCSKREERTFSLIAVATILSALAMSELLGRPHCFAMMEPFLPRLLSRSGMVVHLAGQEIEYHGKRSPYYFETAENVEVMAHELRDFYAAIRSKFAASGLLTPEDKQAAPRASRAPLSKMRWFPPSPGPQPAF